MLRAEIPKDIKKLERQITALKYQISVDTDETDRKIHEETLRTLEGRLRGMEEKHPDMMKQQVQFAVRVSGGVVTGIGKSVMYMPKVQKKGGHT